MVVQNVPHMNSGNENTSYANNSNYQKSVIMKARFVLKDTLEKVYNDYGFSAQCLKIADLGCSSGPNTFVVISEIIETIGALSRQSNHQGLELQIYLNDLPKNDFNAIFKLLPTFYKKVEEGERENGPGWACFVSGVPGSFYDRLFPRQSLHFVHSSYSVHWLSQVPEKLENKGNIYISKTSPPKVYEAYLKQFQKDFSTFLSLRSKEMVACGHMVLTLIGRSTADPSGQNCCRKWELLAESLHDLVSEGLIQEEDIDSFNMPFYIPYKDEVKAIIEEEGSFNLETLHFFEGNWDPNDEDDVHKSGENVANIVRAISEPLLAAHFGDMINTEDLFKIYANRVAHHLLLDKTKIGSITLSLSKK
ncbi:probable jasmonic acid carboxyl methyltransferase 1 [Actinidia eriantha]|uniref:probable jasmonic acid carboxyl methyltransferase 1 n=1 Tax=Actinidia eriantha TaxID=165200 RepID=UPI00258AECB0|nr:probable jasmonic acid carboxyl methyltransferase 1 [Actinidia eriantha]